MPREAVAERDAALPARAMPKSSTFTAPRREHDVAGDDVAMHDPSVVRMAERPCGGCAEPCDRGRAGGSVAPDEVRDRAPGTNSITMNARPRSSPMSYTETIPACAAVRPSLPRP